MKRYRFDGNGLPLAVSQGQIIRLPAFTRVVVGNVNSDPANAENSDGSCITVKFTNLTGEKWLLSENFFHLSYLADGTLRLYANKGIDGPSSTAILTCTAAEQVAAGLVLTTTRPHVFYVEVVTWGPDRSELYMLKLYVDGISLPLTHVDTSGTPWPAASGRIIGGTLLVSYTDFVVFEYFKTYFPHPTANQQKVLYNNGRGCDVLNLHWLTPRIYFLVRFNSAAYDSSNQWFTPVYINNARVTSPSFNSLYYSSAFRTEYGDINRLFFDGINDVVNVADTTQQSIGPIAGHDCTYEFEVLPNKEAFLAAEGGFQISAFSNTDTPCIIGGSRFRINRASVTYIIVIGSNGVSVGYDGLGIYGAEMGPNCILSYTNAFSSTNMTRVGIQIIDRTPKLWINGVLKYTGQRVPVFLKENSSEEYDVMLSANLGEYAYGYGQSHAGTFSGFARNYRIWNYARSDAQMQSATLPVGNEAGLLLFWPLNRVNATTGAGEPTRTTIVDKTGAHPGIMENFVLSPAIGNYKLRIGRTVL